MNHASYITIEKAVQKSGEDLLNYTSFADKIQKIIQRYACVTEPLTIGIYGK